jgi:hypothetical protein
MVGSGLAAAVACASADGRGIGMVGTHTSPPPSLGVEGGVAGPGRSDELFVRTALLSTPAGKCMLFLQGLIGAGSLQPSTNAVLQACGMRRVQCTDQ